MRAQEFLSEAKIATVRSGDLVIDVQDHAVQRANMRGVDPKKVDHALKKLRLVANELNSIEPGMKLWARDAETGVALGLRKLGRPNHIMFATVVAKLTYDSDVPVIELPAAQHLEELTFMGSQCTKDCSGHRAGYAWSIARGRRSAASWSNSFNKGAELAATGH